MNIISIVNGKINKLDLNSELEFDEKNICINTISNSKLYLEIIGDENVKINILVKNDTTLKIFNYSKLEHCSIDFNIVQNENSKLTMNCMFNSNDSKINSLVNLNGKNSIIEYNSSCLGETKKKLRINHNYSNTNSIVKSYAVSDNENINFDIEEFVPKNSVNCNLSQASKIITIKDNKCMIKPILLIDEKDVNASHSSVISPISESDLLYLRSRGIKLEDAKKLLINGFLIGNLSLSEDEKNILLEKDIFRR